MAVAVHFVRKGGDLDLRYNKGDNLWDDYTDKDFADGNSQAAQVV